MIITHYAVYRRLATCAITLAVVVLGFYGLWRLPVNFLPDMTYPMVKLNIVWTGATPEEIERSLADPIERQMMTVDGLDYIESSSIEGAYSLIANFRYDVDINIAYQDASAALARVMKKLPKDIDPPIIFKADPTQLPVMELSVRSHSWDLVKLRTWTDEWLQDQMLAVPGVAGTDIVGGLQREIRVHFKKEALEKYGLSVSAVAKRINDENIQQFGGRITVGRQEIIARTVGEYSTLSDIGNIVLLRTDTATIYLHDVADVIDSHREARVISSVNKQPAVKLSILKQADANTVETALAVKKKLDEIRLSLPDGVELGVLDNQATYIENALNGVKGAAVESAILVVLIVWLFLGSWRQVIVIVLVLPVILIINFGIMKLAGFSLNIFSLGGLVVAIGVLVDNSILVIEAISRRHEEFPDEPIREVAVYATRDIGPAIVASTLAFIVLFIPFLLVPGLVSLLFHELILVVASIVLISLFVAVSLTPMLTSVLLGDSKNNKLKNRFGLWFDKLITNYGELLNKLLNSSSKTVIIFFAIALSGGFVFSLLGTEFLPPMDDGRIMVKVKLPTGTSLAETEKLLENITNTIGNDSQIESLYSMSGGKMIGTTTYETANEGELNIQLLPADERNVTTQEYVNALRDRVKKVQSPGGKIVVSQMKVKGLRKLGDADIELKIKGKDETVLFESARKIAQTMSGLTTFTNVYMSMDLSKPEYQIKIDRIRAAELGISISEVADTVRTLISGSVVTHLRESGRDYDIRMMLPETLVTSRNDLENLKISGSQSNFIRLADIAKISLSAGPVEIMREDQIKTVIVRGDANNVSVGEATAELQNAMAQQPIPPGYQIEYGGQAQMMSDMTQTMLTILGFSIFFSFIVLTVQFNSIKLPMLILGCVPFCLSGMSWLLFVMDKPLGASVIIGLLIVIAAVINAGVLLFTYARVLYETEGLSFRESILKAAMLRLRPRVMVTTAILIGLLPLAFSLESGGEMLQPMAIASIGGLLVENFVSLFLMPCFYLMVNRKPEKETLTVQSGS